MLREEGPKWLWRDGKGDFEGFLRTLDQEDRNRNEVIEGRTLRGVGVFMLETDLTGSWEKDYEQCVWFGYTYLLMRLNIEMDLKLSYCGRNAPSFSWAEGRLW